jgi:4-hydroxy-2-oxoheptanedioate aldolase
VLNRLRSIWAAGRSASNAWLTIPSPWTAEVVAASGFDSVTIDLQHGLIGYETAVAMLQAMAGSETVPLARLEWNDPATIMRMLDAGVLGLICPMINTAAECAAFVGACRYAPAGYRSYGPIRAGLRWGPDYFAQANESVLALAMIETAQGLENVAEIAATPGLDGLYVGPFDLSISLGLAKPADFTDPALQAALDAVLNAAARYELVTGIYAGSPENALVLAQGGFRLVTAAQDTALLQTAVAAAGAQLRAGLS